MKRRSKILLFLPAVLLLVLAALMYGLLRTAPGAQWAWSQAVRNVPGQLQAGSVSGNLRGGLILSEVVYSDDSVIVQANRLQLQLAFDVFPPAIYIESLNANRIDLSLLDNNTDEEKRPLADVLTGLSLPLPIRFSGVWIDRFNILEADQQTLLELSAISLQGRWFKSLEVEEAHLNTGALDWSLDGSIDFAMPFPVATQVSTRVPAGSGGLDFPSDLKIDSRLKGNLLESELAINTDLGGVSANGKLRDLLNQPGWNLSLSSEAMDWPPGSTEPDFSLQNLVMTLSGQSLDYELEASAQFDAADLPTSDVNMAASGNVDGLLFSELNVSSELLELRASGPLSWLDELSFALTAQLRRLNPGFWMDDWPQENPLGGSLDIGWRDGRLVFENLDLAVENNPLRVAGSAQYAPDQDQLAAELTWRSLQWPIGQSPADFESPSGQVTLSGQVDSWKASGNLELQSGDWPSGMLQVDATGTRESVDITVDEGQVLGGQFAGQFSYQWTGSQPWSASIRASKLDVSSLSESLSGILNANLEARGQASPLGFDVNIKQLDGNINGQAVEAEGSMVMEAGTLRARRLNIRSGKSRLLVDGNLQEEKGMSFSGHIESLEEFDENAAGSFTGEGRVSVNPSHPMLELTAQGSNLAWNDWFAESLSVSTDTQSTGDTTIRFAIPSLLRGDQTFENVVFSSSGETPLESLRLSAESEGTVLDVQMDGKIRNWADFPDSAWEGTIETLSLRNDNLGFLELEQSDRVVVSQNSLQLEPACIRGSRNGRVCFDLAWQEQEQFSMNVRVDSVSLHLAQLLLGSHLEFSQTVDGEVHWAKQYGKRASGDVKFTLTPGQVTSEDQSATLQTGPGLLGFRISEGQLLAGNLDITLPGSGVIDTDFSVPDISDGVNSPIEGRIKIDLNSIESLMTWVPQLESASGTVNADVRLTGTITDPKLTGHALLVRGRFEHLATGLSVTDIKLAGAVYDFDYTEMNGSFKSGEGTGQIKAAVKFDNILKPAVTLELAGQNLTLIDIPDMTIKANPDLKLRWQDNALDLSGKVIIPSARIAPRYLPNASASESEDLVFVGEQPPVLEESVIDRSKLRLNGQVEVGLGDDVTVTFQKATAQLRGNTVFTWNNNLLPQANGTFNVSGKLSAYGQTLEVAGGRVSFPNVPADNPHLNINAEREIYGNLQVKKAGVLITGTLKRPVLETYTIPATTSERALTLLVTGHDFDYEQGVGAVEVGMYIAPKLYVSYGVGLFEAQSVVSARYDLGKGFGIKATSGQRETGADITYTIEN